MKYGMILALGLCIAASSATDAASISVEKNPANDAYSLFLNGSAENDAFDTIFVLMKPDAPAAFNNMTGGGMPSIRPPGMAFTYPNRMLNADPSEIPGALGLSQFGVIVTPSELSYTVANLGGTISTAPQPGGNLFLANVNMPGASSSGRATVQILRQGALVQEMNTRFFIPEPAAIALTVAGLWGVSLMLRGRASCRMRSSA
jgi:hypothetical protein